MVEPMKKYFLLIILTIIAASCCPEKKELTSDQIDSEKQAVINVIKAYNQAAEDKNFSAMVETLAGEVIFFGTDSSEIIKTFADYKKQMLRQWEYYEAMKYGELYDSYIQMDDQANFASIIFGVPVTLTRNGITEKHFLRVSRTLKKEKGKWVIVSGIVGIARSGEEIIDSVSEANQIK